MDKIDWALEQMKRQQKAGVKPISLTNMDDPRQFYDYDAAFRNSAFVDKSGHFPSQFKKAGHPNLFVDGVNTKTGEAATAYGQVMNQIQNKLVHAKTTVPEVIGSTAREVADTGLNFINRMQDKFRAQAAPPTVPSKYSDAEREEMSKHIGTPEKKRKLWENTDQHDRDMRRQ